MKLNVFEKVLVNNPLAHLALRATCRRLRQMAGGARFERVLEIGCGDGAGALAIAAAFEVGALDAFDVDEAQVALARERLRARDGVRLWTGDAERIDAPGGAYDAVFEFKIFHHVPDWRRALAEVGRVLRPGGLFLFEELSREYFDTPVIGTLLRRFTVHPWETMFTFPEFRAALDEAGFPALYVASGWMPGWHEGVARVAVPAATAAHA
jgi:ubiquinone/menaquinone biosynthesis C-methylase UbiE